jgi:hypothetical protein
MCFEDFLQRPEGVLELLRASLRQGTGQRLGALQSGD